jgi:hypothetical protein
MHAGRFRWDIRHGDAAILSSPDSYVSEGEALRAGAEAVLKLQS